MYFIRFYTPKKGYIAIIKMAKKEGGKQMKEGKIIAISNQKGGTAKNSGKHAAVLCGYHFSKGDLIVNLDDDYQCPVYELWSLVEQVEAGFDVPCFLK